MSYTKLKQEMAERGFEVSEGNLMTAQDQAISRDFFYVTGKKMEDFVDIMGRPVDLSAPESFEPAEDGDTVEAGEAVEAGEIGESEGTAPIVIESMEPPALTTEEALSLNIAQETVAEQAQEVAQEVAEQTAEQAEPTETASEETPNPETQPEPQPEAQPTEAQSQE